MFSISSRRTHSVGPYKIDTSDFGLGMTHWSARLPHAVKSHSSLDTRRFSCETLIFSGMFMSTKRHPPIRIEQFADALLLILQLILPRSAAGGRLGLWMSSRRLVAVRRRCSQLNARGARPKCAHHEMRKLRTSTPHERPAPTPPLPFGEASTGPAVSVPNSILTQCYKYLSKYEFVLYITML